MTPMRDFEILEKSLSDMLDHNFIDADCYGSLLPYLKKIKQALTELEKQTQILEVLKNKRVNIMKLCCSDLLVYYNESGVYEELTQEEYDLLKEWLEQ